jgi:phage terminase large subunit
MDNLIGRGVFLQMKQMAASSAARACDVDGGPTKVAYGGARGGGKSFWVLAQAGADDCQRVPGLKVLLLRKVGKSQLEAIEDLRKRVFAGIPHTFVSHRGILHFPNGSRIVVGHYQKEGDIDGYLGLEYDVVVIEEATTLTERKVKDILTCLRTSKPDWRPRAYLNANPGGVGHHWFKRWFIDPFRKGQESDTRFIPALATDNRYNNVDYISVLNALKGWQREAWRDGSWDLPLGQYFSNFVDEVHVVDELDESMIVEWRAALDYGFTHYTAVYLGGWDGDGNIHVVDRHRERGWLPQRHAPAIKSMLARHKFWLPNRGTTPLKLEFLRSFVSGADCFSKQRDGTTVAQSYGKLGIKLQCANTDRIQGWGEMLRRFGDVTADPPIRPTLFVHRRCGELIDSLGTLQHDPHRPEDVLKVDTDDEGRGGDDDADAVRYLVMSKGRSVVQTKLRGL